LILQVLVVILALIMLLAPFIFKQPSHQAMAEECAVGCKENGKLGMLVKQDGPASPKPAAQKFACVCS
jgi:hypothetical protein